jgi:MFS family permease
MPTFIFLWLGQTISLIGSGLTSFALGVSIYQTNSSIAQFSIIYFCTELPAILIAPVSGAIADKWDKRWVMMVSDSGAGFSTLVIALLFWSDRWEIGYIYLAIAFGSF